jgi:chitin disaccharide deacetylase
MGAAKRARRLIVNADDFGRSESINRAVIDAHRRGILTTASLMVTGDAFEEAVELAREHPTLGVGLHLALCCGRSALKRDHIPTLVNANGQFRNNPVAAGMKYFFSARARVEIAREVVAQFDLFRKTGLRLDHVNGHLHFHLHPAVFLRLGCRELKIGAMRLTRDPLSVDWALGRGRYFYRLSHAIIFSLLSWRAGRALREAGIAHTDYVFGLLENERVTEDYLLKLIPRLPPGDSEVYSHPSLGQFKHEYDALISAQVRAALEQEGIQLIRYQDL